MRLRRTCLLCRRTGWRWAMRRSPLTGLWYCRPDDEDCKELWAARLRSDASAELRRLEREMWGRETHLLAEYEVVLEDEPKMKTVQIPVSPDLWDRMKALDERKHDGV